MVEMENALIESIQKMDLEEKEAQIYFSLLKYGKQGTFVRSLREELPYIERSTLYSILKRLIEKGCVLEDFSSVESKKLKIFIAKDPTEYFNKIYSNKKNELDELGKIKQNMLKTIQNLYINGLNLASDDIDPVIQPYFDPLLTKGWLIKTQKKTEGINIFGGDIYYEYYLTFPKYMNILNKIGIFISIYDSNIEADEITIKFITNQLKKVIREFHKSDFKRIIINDGTIDLLGNEFPSFLIKAELMKPNSIINFGETALIPIKNKIFFIWEELNREKGEISKNEQHKILLEIVKPIFEFEKTY